MSQFNYKTLLQYLDISHGQFIIILIVLFFVASFFYFFYKLGLLTPIRFRTETLPKSELIYISYEGSYDFVQQSFDQIIQAMSQVFKLSEPFGIYYDNPRQISNPEESRAILGCLVNELEKDKVPLFQSKFPSYRHKQIEKQTQCIGTNYPFFNALSMILIITRVYPRLAEEVKKRKIQKSIGIIQIYKTIQDKNQHVKILLPIENLEEFQLWYPPNSYCNDKKFQQTKKQV